MVARRTAVGIVVAFQRHHPLTVRANADQSQPGEQGIQDATESPHQAGSLLTGDFGPSAFDVSLLDLGFACHRLSLSL